MIRLPLFIKNLAIWTRPVHFLPLSRDILYSAAEPVTRPAAQSISFNLLFAPIAKYWDYANEDDVERAKMTLLEDGNLLIALTTASGQGGVVAIWDTGKDHLIHVSEGPYAVAANMYDGAVYTLCCILHWGVKEHFAVTKAPLGSMDAWKEVGDVEKITFDEYEGSFVDFEVTDREYKIIMHEKEYSIARQ